MVSAAKKKAYKQYFTPSKIAELLVNNVGRIKSPKTIIDLSVGQADLLFACKNRWGKAELFGIDIDETMINHLQKLYPGYFKLMHTDGLNVVSNHSTEEYLKCIKEGGFDLCVANPPFDASYRAIKKDVKKVIPLENLFIEKYINICKIGGYIAIIIPNGLVSNSRNKYIRDYILCNSKVCKIISLPDEIFPSASAKTEILILRKSKSVPRKHTIIFKEYDKHLKQIHEFEMSCTKTQLMQRMDYGFYYNASLSSQIPYNPVVKRKPFQELLEWHGRGGTEYGKNRSFSNEGIRYIHSTNIDEIGINFKKEELHIDINSKMYKRNAHLQLNDVIFVRVGNTLGKSAIVINNDQVGVASDCLYIFRFNKLLNPFYFIVLTKTSYMKRCLDYLSHGSCSKVISKKDLLNLLIPVPELRIQEYYARRYQRIVRSFNTSETTSEVTGALTRLVNQLNLYLWREDNEKDNCQVYSAT